MFGPQPGLQQE